MSNWNLIELANYFRDCEWYGKKRPNELRAVLDNLDTYFRALQEAKNPWQVRSGFIHPKPNGIVAIDQKGGGQKVKLEQTRLYVFPDTNGFKLYLLAIGNKSSQHRDIQTCREMVRKIQRDKEIRQ